MSEQATIARPYAKAAFDYAVEHNEIDLWKTELQTAAMVSLDASMQSLIKSNMRSESIAEIFLDICGKNWHSPLQNFIRVMAENKRLSLLAEVFSLYDKYREEKESTMQVDLISVSPLTSSQLDKIKQAVEQKLSKKVSLNTTIDASIMAGFIIRAGDLVIDNSIKGRLNRLSTALQS